MLKTTLKITGAASTKTTNRTRLPILPSTFIRASRPRNLLLPQDFRIQSAEKPRTRSRRCQNPKRRTEKDRRCRTALGRRDRREREPSYTRLVKELVKMYFTVPNCNITSLILFLTQICI